MSGPVMGKSRTSRTVKGDEIQRTETKRTQSNAERTLSNAGEVEPTSSSSEVQALREELAQVKRELAETKAMVVALSNTVSQLQRNQ